jgi:transcriptional regulator with XRE-family HTH domain
MITAAQLKATRAMLGIDQKTLAELAGVSVPTVQRMEAGFGSVRGTIESPTRLIAALDRAGVELMTVDMKSNANGRGVRLKAVVGAMTKKVRAKDARSGNVSS